MRTLVIGLVGLSVAGFGLLAVPDSSAIIVRHDVADAEYVVADADYPALTDLISRGDCIGTLIHESFVLSVAHCAVDLSPGDSLEIGGAAHVVADVYLHPQWENRDKYDIALVRLEEPVTGVDPIPIYRGSDELGAVVTLVGRGVTATGVDGEAGGHTDGKLRRATNVVSAVNDQFLEVVFERPGEDGITDSKASELLATAAAPRSSTWTGRDTSPDSTRGATEIAAPALASTARSTTRLACRASRAGWTRSSGRVSSPDPRATTAPARAGGRSEWEPSSACCS